MKAAIYKQDDDCGNCLLVIPYVRHVCHDGNVIHDIDAVLASENPSDKQFRAQIRADVDYQGGRLPLVYIDGVYQDLDKLMGKAKAWRISQNYVPDKSETPALY